MARRQSCSVFLPLICSEQSRKEETRSLPQPHTRQRTASTVSPMNSLPMRLRTRRVSSACCSSAQVRSLLSR